MNATYEFTLKEGLKVKMKIFWGTKSWRKFLDGLKRKCYIFIGTKNIFNPNKYRNFFLSILNNIPWKLINYWVEIKKYKNVDKVVQLFTIGAKCVWVA